MNGNARLQAGGEEAAERLGGRHLRAAAAHLRAEAAPGERVHLLLEAVAERQLDVGLADEPVEAGLPARLDRLDLEVAARRRVEQEREPRSSPSSSSNCEAGQTSRASSQACSSARARRSSAIASGTDRLAGGKSGAWSIRWASAARRASCVSVTRRV